jgi:hypothetical protein
MGTQVTVELSFWQLFCFIIIKNVLETVKNQTEKIVFRQI